MSDVGIKRVTVTIDEDGTELELDYEVARELFNALAQIFYTPPATHPSPPPYAIKTTAGRVIKTMDADDGYVDTGGSR